MKCSRPCSLRIAAGASVFFARLRRSLACNMLVRATILRQQSTFTFTLPTVVTPHVGLLYTAAILSRGTEKALFYLPRPRSEKLGGEARQVEQSYSDILGQNGRYVTKAHAHPLRFGSRGLFVFDASPKCVDREGQERRPYRDGEENRYFQLPLLRTPIQHRVFSQKRLRWRDYPNIPFAYTHINLKMLRFNFTLGLNFIFFCFKLLIVYYHTQKQKKIEFKPRMKLNHNIYTWTEMLIQEHNREFCCLYSLDFD